MRPRIALRRATVDVRPCDAQRVSSPRDFDSEGFVRSCVMGPVPETISIRTFHSTSTRQYTRRRLGDGRSTWARNRARLWLFTLPNRRSMVRTSSAELSSMRSTLSRHQPNLGHRPRLRRSRQARHSGTGRRRQLWLGRHKRVQPIHLFTRPQRRPLPLMPSTREVMHCPTGTGYSADRRDLSVVTIVCGIALLLLLFSFPILFISARIISIFL